MNKTDARVSDFPPLSGLTDGGATFHADECLLDSALCLRPCVAADVRCTGGDGGGGVGGAGSNSHPTRPSVGEDGTRWEKSTPALICSFSIPVSCSQWITGRLAAAHLLLLPGLTPCGFHSPPPSPPAAEASCVSHAASTLKEVSETVATNGTDNKKTTKRDDCVMN